MHNFWFLLLELAIETLMMMQIWVPTNPRGAERLPPGIVESESDFNLRRLWGLPNEVLVAYGNFATFIWPNNLVCKTSE